MHLRPATLDDAAVIAGIYNQAVVATTASFDIEPKSTEDRTRWLEGRRPQHPVIVAEDDGSVVGWGALSPYSDRPAYDATVEISVYVDAAWHQHGVGRALSRALLDRAAEVGLHAIIARICTENVASIVMVRSLGFAEAGTMHEVGRKFDRWLDVVTWEYRVPGDAGVSKRADSGTHPVGTRHEGRHPMKAIVDQTLCIGCGLCELTCPEVFRMAEEGVAYTLTDDPPPETYDDIQACVELCPVTAISIASE